MSSNGPSPPRTKGRSVIRGGSGEVLYDSGKDEFKSSSVIYSADKKRILSSSEATL